MNPIFARRSVRSFEDRPVEREKLERIARAGQLAHSAMGRFPWEILIATSPEAKQAVQEMSPYSKMAGSAGAIIGRLVPICGKPKKNTLGGYRIVLPARKISCCKLWRKGWAASGWAPIQSRNAG